MAAQERALAVIHGRLPDHAVLAEEMEPDERARLIERGGPLWVVDPLDGTTNFLHGHPMFAASVALTVDGTSVLGAVEQAVTGETWWATRDGGAWWQAPGQPTRRLGVTRPPSLERALVGTGFPFKALDLLPEYLVQFDRVLRSSAGIRRTGSAALDLCYLASGRLDAFWELHLSPWDYAAGWVIVEEAGGVVERLSGEPLTLAEGTVAGAGSASLLRALRDVMKEGPGAMPPSLRTP